MEGRKGRKQKKKKEIAKRSSMMISHRRV
jgi:hypothetical protein